MSFKDLIANGYDKSKQQDESDSGGVHKKVKLDHNVNTSISSSKLESFPDFLIVGAQKAGTMAAVMNLNKHPDIFVVKEAHYFDLAWHSKSPSWYKEQFQSNKRVKGEKTPEYIYVDECAERIKEVSPNAKFVLFLRDPVARAFSSWNMNTSKGRESAPFDECVTRNMNNLGEFRSYGTAEFHYIQRGFYLEQIERFMKVFPDRSKLLIVIAERIKRDPQTEYNRIFDFLGVERFQFTAENEHTGEYGSRSMGAKMEERLRKTFKPHNEKLFKFLGYRIPEWEGESTGGSTISSDANAGGGISITSQSSTTSNSNKSNDLKTNSSGKSALSSSTAAVPGGQSVSSYAQSTVTLDGQFASIGKKHGTDKISHHGYQRYYPRYLEHYRVVGGAGGSGPAAVGGGMLEIGIDQSHSLHTWLDYFPHAFIYGIDISVTAKGPRHLILQADQSRLSEVRRVVDRDLKHPLFFIIDDGSHVPEHQVQCFDYLFGTVLLPGGTYILEDIETSYWTRNNIYGYPTRYGYHHERSAVEIFKDLVDDINREFLTERNRSAQEERVGQEVSSTTRRHISSITFGQNCIVVVKKTNEELLTYDDRVYRFRGNL